MLNEYDFITVRVLIEVSGKAGIPPIFAQPEESNWLKLVSTKNSVFCYRKCYENSIVPLT